MPVTAGWRVFARILLVIFGVEIIVLRVLPPTLPLGVDFIDALALAILSAPLLWLIVAKPLAMGAEAARLRLEARVANILQTSVDGILTADARGIISQFNAGAEKMFGYAARDVVGQNFNLLLPERARTVHPEHVAHFAAVREGSRAIGQGAQLEGRRKNGEIFPAEVTISKLGDGDDTMLTAVVRDGTARSRAEQELRASEQRYRSLFANMLNGFAHCRMVYDEHDRPVNFVYLSVNEAFGRLTGLTNVVGKHVSEVIPGIRELSPELFETFGRVAATGIPESFEFDFKSQDQWLTISVYSPEKGSFVAVFDDITERKRWEADLHLQSTALNAAADPMVITDRDGTIAWINAAFTECTGNSAEESVGKNEAALLRSGAHGQAFYKEQWDTILAGNVWRGEVTNRRKDGSLYPEMQTITPVRAARGEISHFIAVKRDLTKEKQLQAQLLQAQKMESVGRLAGGVAHDFNNLLSVIIGWTEMATAALPAGHPIRPSLEEVLGAGQRAADLTRQLLAFSRQQVVEPVLFNVNGLVVEMEKMLRRLLGEDVELTTLTDPELGTVNMDRGQLDQVLMNLVVNARDAMPGGGKLTIETANVELDAEYPRTHADVTPGDYVMLAVSDSGTGMSEDVKTHIFEPFFTTKEQGKGTGLGLATSYGIVKQAGGHIGVYSEKGVGTSMKVYLPRTREAAEQVVRAGRMTPSHGVETILLVEDEPAVRRVIMYMLEARGYRVVSTSSGEEALRVIEEEREPLHLLLTDVVLSGGMSGPVLAERVRALRPNLKVLFASGYTSDVTILHGLLEHGIALVQKPFTAESLGEKVRQVLDAK